MIKAIQDIFLQFTAPAPASPSERAHELQLASAVLLAEVMRADPQLHAAEHDAVWAGLRQRFALSDAELHVLVQQARQQGESTYDYHRFTQVINGHFSHDQKVSMVESMWQVAYADLHLDAHENHLISKIAGLLHVTHGEYIAAKMRAKEAAGLPLASKP